MGGGEREEVEKKEVEEGMGEMVRGGEQED